MRMFYPLLFTASALGFSVLGGVPIGLALAYSTLITSGSYLISQINFTPVVHFTRQRTRPVFTFITDSWDTFLAPRRYPSYQNYGVIPPQVPPQVFRQPSPVPPHSGRRPVASVVTPVPVSPTPPPSYDSGRRPVASVVTPVPVPPAPPPSYDSGRRPVASVVTPVPVPPAPPPSHNDPGRHLFASSVKPITPRYDSSSPPTARNPVASTTSHSHSGRNPVVSTITPASHSHSAHNPVAPTAVTQNNPGRRLVHSNIKPV